MKDKIITGIFSLLLLLISSTAAAGTMSFQFTSTISWVDGGSSPLAAGNVVQGNVELNDGDIFDTDVEDWPSEIGYNYYGLSSFGIAGVPPDGATWSLTPDVTFTTPQSIERYIENNYAVTQYDIDYDLPPGMEIPDGFVAGTLVDVLEIEVYDKDFDFDTGAGNTFSLLAIFLATEGVVDDDLNVDMNKLFSSAFYVGFTAGEMQNWGPDDEDDVYVWRAGGLANATASAVPIPAAIWLFGGGLTLLGTIRRRWSS